MQATPGEDSNDIYTREWHVDSDVPMSEDCLYLNIWTPAKSANEKLPVMFWIFGGALQVGYPSEMEFDGERSAGRRRCHALRESAVRFRPTRAILHLPGKAKLL